MSKKRLAAQLFFSYFWIALVAVALAAYLGSAALSNFYRERTAADLQARATLLIPRIEEMLKAEDYVGIDQRVRQLGQSISTRITVVLRSGEVVGDSDENPDAMDNHGDRPEIRQAFETGGIGRETRWSATLKRRLMYVAVPVDDPAEPGRIAAVVRTSIPVTSIQETLSTIRLRLAAGAVTTIGLIALVSFWTSLRISRMVKTMARGAEEFAEGRLDHRLEPTGLVEIDVLAESMNRMASELSRRIDTITRQQNELEAVLVSMQEGVLAVNNDGIVINLNEACADLISAEPGRVRGRLLHEVVRTSDLLQFVEATLAADEPLEEDIRIRGDEEHWLSAHGTRLHDAQGRKIGALVILFDVTRLRRLENVRRDFVANVSHELKTPITSIKGFVETLLDGAMDEPENLVRFLNIVSRQVNRLEAIIEDLLMLSRLEKGSAEELQRLEVGRVREVVQAAVEMCENKAKDKEIRIETECPIDPAVRMSPPLLEQAMVNLIDNAIKYSPAGSRVHVSVEQDAEKIALRVRDEGCGIEPKHLPRLFERFYRADKARSREMGGTGLGLSIVKHIALVHHGSVDVKSTVGRGSTFSLLLPANDPKEPAA